MSWIEFWADKEEQHVELDAFPKTCPYCRLLINAEFRVASFFHREDAFSGSSQTYLEAVFRCPSEDCSRLFTGLYEAPKGETRVPFSFVKTIPATSQTRSFDDFLAEVSPAFCEIWNQAYQAEQAGLTEICGMGFRKALEFLIKDYLIRQKPEKKQSILSTFLGTCISDHIDDPRIKSCAKRAVWLGNDESHYLRKWIGKDVEDLKVLIDLTVHWMLMQHLTERYQDEMGESNKADAGDGR